jgi:putative transposase
MDYRRARQDGGVYFFTLVTRARLPLFGVPENIELLKRAMNHVKERHPFAMPGYVILPDHLHCLWRLPEKDHDFSMRWRLVKHFVSGKTKQRPFWQKRFWEHAIRDEDDYRRHLDYIHYNPVKHGLVARPGDWPHSSYSHYLRLGMADADWGVAREFDGEFGE